MQGVIERRILVNYHVEPAVMAHQLPRPFRPQVVHGRAIAGICLIRLGGVRPRFVPWRGGIGSENAAHRVAVEWDDDGQLRQGVYVPRRDTNSRLNAMVGGRLFPGIHHHAHFGVDETDERLSVAIDSDDGQTRVKVVAHVTDRLGDSSVFASLAEASAFFEAGSLGYSATPDGRRFHGIELQCRQWRVQPLAIEQVASSYFDDEARFPAGSIGFDCALLMRGIEHEWHSRHDLCCTAAGAEEAEHAKPHVAAASVHHGG